MVLTLVVKEKKNLGLTNFTPCRRHVDSVAFPDERVDKQIQAAQGSPEDIIGSARIPRLEMPRQRNKGKKKAKEGEDGEQRVSGV